jgi:hypothetical protein
MLDGVAYLSVLETATIFLPEKLEAYDKLQRSLFVRSIAGGSGRRWSNKIAVNEGHVSKSAEENLITVSFRGNTVSGISTASPLKYLVSKLTSRRLIWTH